MGNVISEEKCMPLPKEGQRELYSCGSQSYKPSTLAEIEFKPELLECLNGLYHDVADAGSEKIKKALEEWVSQKMAGAAHESNSSQDNLTSALMFLSEDIDIDYAENYYHFWLLIKESGLDDEEIMSIVKDLQHGDKPKSNIDFEDPVDNWNGVLCEINIPIAGMKLFAC